MTRSNTFFFFFVSAALQKGKLVVFLICKENVSQMQDNVHLP